jgi:PAB1-binding protein PBP1
MTESAEIARLQTDLLASQSTIEDLTAHVTTLQTLNTDYENAISHTLDKLRPFAQAHAQALLAQKAHYLTLLDHERSQNLELRLEQSQWQEKAKEIKDMMVEAMKFQSESEIGYVGKIARLKADNRSLRRICGVPLQEDSEDDEAAAMLESSAAAVERHLARESVRHSPEMERGESSAVVFTGEEKQP